MRKSVRSDLRPDGSSRARDQRVPADALARKREFSATKIAPCQEVWIPAPTTRTSASRSSLRWSDSVGGVVPSHTDVLSTPSPVVAWIGPSPRTVRGRVRPSSRTGAVLLPKPTGDKTPWSGLPVGLGG